MGGVRERPSLHRHIGERRVDDGRHDELEAGVHRSRGKKGLLRGHPRSLVDLG